jgi:hypothetical protein
MPRDIARRSRFSRLASTWRDIARRNSSRYANRRATRSDPHGVPLRSAIEFFIESAYMRRPSIASIRCNDESIAQLKCRRLLMNDQSHVQANDRSQIPVLR